MKDNLLFLKEFLSNVAIGIVSQTMGFSHWFVLKSEQSESPSKHCHFPVKELLLNFSNGKEHFLLPFIFPFCLFWRP